VVALPAPSMFHRKMRLAFREMRFQAKRLRASLDLVIASLVTAHSTHTP
jgi:hypothetical protein